MVFAYFAGGILIGIVISIFYNKFIQVAGFIEIDDKTGLCRVVVTSETIQEKRVKHAFFKIKHGVSIRVNNGDYNEDVSSL